jgi:hypothetical protein
MPYKGQIVLADEKQKAGLSSRGAHPHPLSRASGWRGWLCRTSHRPA